MSVQRWVAPPVQGTSAALHMEAYVAAAHAERAALHAAQARRPLRPPLQRATDIDFSDRRAPRDARACANGADADGWAVRVTYAYGWTPDANGDEETIPVWELTGEETESGKPARRKVGEKEKPPVHSVRVLLRHPDDPQLVVTGHWLDEAFDFATIHTRERGWYHEPKVTQMRTVIRENAPGAAYLF